MAAPRLYLDEDVDPLVARALRDRGSDVLTTGEAGLLGASDEAQLGFAIGQARTILTHNVRHFVTRARDYASTGQMHYGIIVSDRPPFREVLRRTLRLLDQLHRFRQLNRVR